MGQLLITFLLCERRVLSHPLLYLSHYFKRRRAEYYDRLQAVRIDGAWEAWLGFFLRGVQEVAEDAARRARSIVELRERSRELVSARGGRQSAHLQRALDVLFKQPLASANSLMKDMGVAFTTANTVALKLSQLGLLQEETGYKRNRRFRFAPYLALFEDAPEAEDMAIDREASPKTRR